MEHESKPILVSSLVAAGFPSPAEDFTERPLDLNELLVSHPVASFFVRVSGDSMIEAGIHAGDILIVDRSLMAQPKDIVVAYIEGGFTVKRYVRYKNRPVLKPENSQYKAQYLDASPDAEIWGVVTGLVRQFKRANSSPNSI